MKKNIIIVCVAVAGLIVWLNFRGPEMPAPEAPDFSSRIRYEQGEIQSVEMSPADGLSGIGVAARVWDGKLFAHSINADLDAPPAGKYYAGWLVRPETLTSLSTGKLARNAIGYGLSFTSPENLPEYTGALVTLEQEGRELGDTPGTRVLEGSF